MGCCFCCKSVIDNNYSLLTFKYSCHKIQLKVVTKRSKTYIKTTMSCIYVTNQEGESNEKKYFTL